MRPVYLYNGTPYIGNTTSLYWNTQNSTKIQKGFSKVKSSFLGIPFGVIISSNVWKFHHFNHLTRLLLKQRSNTVTVAWTRGV